MCVCVMLTNYEVPMPNMPRRSFDMPYAGRNDVNKGRNEMRPQLW